MSRRVLRAIATAGLSLAVAVASVLLFGSVVRASVLLELPPVVGLVAALVAGTLPVCPVVAAWFRERAPKAAEAVRPASGPVSDRVPAWLPEARQRAWHVLPIRTRPLDPPRREE